jgi:DNA mismatch endonuclease (patch repair protein)
MGRSLESWASSPGARATMVANRRRDTAPELRLRSELHRRGLRYKVDAAPTVGIRRRADLVFSAARVAVFVHGCFWHGCPIHYVAPRTNAEFWREKLRANRARDADTNARLLAAGWIAFVVWEHDDFIQSADELEVLVRSRRVSNRNLD